MFCNTFWDWWIANNDLFSLEEDSFIFISTLLHFPLVNINLLTAILADRSLYNSHLSGFTHQLRTTDAETNSQTLGVAWGILWKRGWKDWKSQRGRGYHKKTYTQLTWAHRGLQKLNQQPNSMHGMDLVLLQICNICTSLSSCETSNSRS